MGFLDRLLGREEPQDERTRQYQPAQQYPSTAAPAPAPADAVASAASGAPAASGVPAPAGAAAPSAQRTDDEIAVERYRYLLRTAPPETIEQVHEEAFAKLTPEQRRLVFQELSANAPAGEQPRADDARSLAQAATRSELRQPGTLERTLGARPGGGMGFGGMFASSLLGSVAGYGIASTRRGSGGHRRWIARRRLGRQRLSRHRLGRRRLGRRRNRCAGRVRRLLRRCRHLRR